MRCIALEKYRKVIGGSGSGLLAMTSVMVPITSSHVRSRSSRHAWYSRMSVIEPMILPLAVKAMPLSGLCPISTNNFPLSVRSKSGADFFQDFLPRVGARYHHQPLYLTLCSWVVG